MSPPDPRLLVAHLSPDWSNAGERLISGLRVLSRNGELADDSLVMRHVHSYASVVVDFRCALGQVHRSADFSWLGGHCPCGDYQHRESAECKFGGEGGHGWKWWIGLLKLNEMMGSEEAVAGSQVDRRPAYIAVCEADSATHRYVASASATVLGSPTIWSLDRHASFQSAME